MSWIEGYTKQYQEWLAVEHLSVQSAAHQKSGSVAVTSDAYTDYINQHAARNGQPMIDRRERDSPASSNAHGEAEETTITSATMEPRPSITPAHLPLHLSQTFNKALFAFFSPDSSFQLNLTAEVVARITMDSQHSPDPSIFRAAKEAVEAMLNASLQKYLIEVSGSTLR